MSEQNEKKEAFSYTYSAGQKTEIEAIRKKYLPREESRMERLRRLDASASRKGTTVALCVGIVSCLVMGVGMCCTMVWTDWFAAGILIGLAGIAGMAAAYPLYTRITRREREKVAPEIIRLTDELLK